MPADTLAYYDTDLFLAAESFVKQVTDWPNFYNTQTLKEQIETVQKDIFCCTKS